MRAHGLGLRALEEIKGRMRELRGKYGSLYSLTKR